MYNSSAFLPDLLRSLENQTIAKEKFEIIFVDDGSLDDSVQVLEAWKRDREQSIFIFSKENGGQASARNLGLANSVGEWVTFIDADDFVARDYLELVSQAAFPGDHIIISTALVFYYEESRRTSRWHARRENWARRPGLYNLHLFPYLFPSGPANFYRRNFLEINGLTQSEELRPIFEDNHFAARVLMKMNQPIVFFHSRASYFYRKRAAKDSTVDISSKDPRSLLDVYQFGYLDLVKTFRDQNSGPVPLWLCSLLQYELSWVLESRLSLRTSQALNDTQLKLHLKLLKLLMSELPVTGPETIVRKNLDLNTQLILQSGLRLDRWHMREWCILEPTNSSRVWRIRAYSNSAKLDISVITNGKSCDVLESRVLTDEYRGLPLLFIHTITFQRASGDLEVLVEGESIPVKVGPMPNSVSEVERLPFYSASEKFARLRFLSTETNGRNLFPILVLFAPFLRAVRFLKIQGKIRKIAEYYTPPVLFKRLEPLMSEIPKIMDRAANSRSQRLLNLPYIKKWAWRKYSGCWLISDRLDQGNDNGEHFFKFLYKNHPEVKPFFVVSRESLTYKELKSAGFPVLALGSYRHKWATLFSEVWASSHADEENRAKSLLAFASLPKDRVLNGPIEVFLQHGVIQHDLTKWLNPKKFDLIVTTTRKEYQEITRSPGPWDYGANEAILTGLPRHDRLTNLSLATPDKRQIIFAPTWRHYLKFGRTLARDEKERLKDQFLQDLKDISLELQHHFGENYEIRFLRHPEITYLGDDLQLPISDISWANSDVQKEFASTKLLITDYSSVAFDLAQIGSDIIYYQPDRNLVFGGFHTTRPGYFDYERDGFGPVATSIEEFCSHLNAWKENPDSYSKYRQRAKNTFEFNDARNSQRVYKAILTKLAQMKGE